MKVLVISDIHGSSYYAKKIKEINKKEEINFDEVDAQLTARMTAIFLLAILAKW